MKSERTHIRFAAEEDIHIILDFIRKKAEFDTNMKGFSGVVQASENTLCKTLFGPTPFAKVLLAEICDSPQAFALYYFRYSSFKGRPCLWLDDLFVNDIARSQGIGAALMRRLAQIAVENECTNMAWTASLYNTRGVRFYERLGAKIIEQRGKILLLETEEQIIHDLAQRL